MLYRIVDIFCKPSNFFGKIKFSRSSYSRGYLTRVNKKLNKSYKHTHTHDYYALTGIEYNVLIIYGQERGRTHGERRPCVVGRVGGMWREGNRIEKDAAAGSRVTAVACACPLVWVLRARHRPIFRRRPRSVSPLLSRGHGDAAEERHQLRVAGVQFAGHGQIRHRGQVQTESE